MHVRLAKCPRQGVGAGEKEHRIREDPSLPTPAGLLTIGATRGGASCGCSHLMPNVDLPSEVDSKTCRRLTSLALGENPCMLRFGRAVANAEIAITPQR